MTQPVAFVHDWLTGQRGGENVLREMARLAPSAPIYTLFHFAGTVDPEIEAHPIRTSFLQGAPGLDPHYRWMLPLFPAGAGDLDVRAHRIVLSTSHCVVKSVVRAPGAYHLCYCHTPMRYAWDQEATYFGRGRGPLALARRIVLARLRRWDAATAGRVDRYVANSRFVADRIRRYYGRHAEVLAPPVDTSFFTPPETPPGRAYVLMVAALSPYKKVDLSLRACRELGLPLRVVGTGPEADRLARQASPETTFEGRVTAERLRELYRGALCFLQPGVEDFGIAAAEALACGTPVVALGAGGVLDIVEAGKHGILFPRDEVSDIAQAIDKSRQIEFNPMNLRERAETFSAEHFARRLRELVVSDRPDAEEYLE